MKEKDPEKPWHEILSPDVYHVTREGGTEPAFSGQYDKFFANGQYLCSNCKNYLFCSADKYDSGTGWPSFFNTATKNSVALHPEQGSTLVPGRIEVRCANCAAHLGHVFNDGPKPTGLRYCMNSLALNFKPDQEKT